MIPAAYRGVLSNTQARRLLAGLGGGRVATGFPDEAAG